MRVVIVWVWLVSTVAVVSSFSCIDPDGSPVDWYIVYKVPKLRRHSDPLVSDGVAHFYMDVNHPKWKMSKISISDPGHALYNTLKQLYSQDNLRHPQSAYVLFNDQIPDGRWTRKYGHTKGLIGFQKSGGFWLSHTVPHFPPAVKDGYAYPHSGHLFGQSAICVSLDYKYLDVIGYLFRYNYPWVYDHSLPESFAKDNQNLAAYLHDPDDARKHRAPWSHVAPMTTVAGMPLISFAKFVKYDADIYGAWLTQTFKESLYAETWQRSGPNLPSNCSGDYKVYNVKAVRLPNGIRFTNNHDHSKWAVSVTNDSLPTVCMADNNRQETQLTRAGGAICIHNNYVWQQFKSIVADYTNCDNTLYVDV